MGNLRNWNFPGISYTHIIFQQIYSSWSQTIKLNCTRSRMTPGFISSYLDYYTRMCDKQFLDWGEYFIQNPARGFVLATKFHLNVVTKFPSWYFLRGINPPGGCQKLDFRDDPVKISHGKISFSFENSWITFFDTNTAHQATKSFQFLITIPSKCLPNRAYFKRKLLSLVGP